ncbi:MAG: leucine-rich repeat domain-containing protein, partial [Clostridia bacterium]|nr:leucine-rich repeat domain-containing protein [Clostridia bacterium]
PTYDQIAERPGNESSGLEYTYTEGVGLIITGIGSCKDKDIVIPEWIDGFPVVSIASQAFVGANIKSVYIPKTVKFVGFYAFASCESLETVVLPPNIDMIKQETFRGCSSLKNITIPERVTQIGPQSFGGCSSLEEINIPYGVTFIGNNAFAGSSIKSIYLPDSVQNIEYGAFYKCKYLTTVYIPKSVTSVGNDVFAECDNLRGIYCECFSVPNGWNANWNRNCGAEVYLAQSVRPDIYYPIIDPAVNDNIGICVSNASVKANNISGYSSAFSGFAETNISLNASAKELKCYPSISLPDIIPEGGSVHYTFSIDPFYNVSESKLSDYVVIVSDFVISAEGYEDIISPGYVMDMPKDLESKYLDLWYVAYNYFGTEERAISYIESINKITFNVSVKPRAFARQNRF